MTDMVKEDSIGSTLGIEEVCIPSGGGGEVVEKRRTRRARRRSSCSMLPSSENATKNHNEATEALLCSMSETQTAQLASFLHFHNLFAQATPLSVCAVTDDAADLRGSGGTTVDGSSKKERKSEDKPSRRRQKRRSSWHAASPGAAFATFAQQFQVSSRTMAVEEEEVHQQSVPDLEPPERDPVEKFEESVPDDPPVRRRRANRRSSWHGSSLAPGYYPAPVEEQPIRHFVMAAPEEARAAAPRKEADPPSTVETQLSEEALVTEDSKRRARMNRRSSWHAGSSCTSPVQTILEEVLPCDVVAPPKEKSKRERKRSAPSKEDIQLMEIQAAEKPERISRMSRRSSWHASVEPPSSKDVVATAEEQEHISAMPMTAREIQKAKEGTCLKDVSRTLLMVKHAQTGRSKARRIRASWTGAYVWTPEQESEEQPASPKQQEEQPMHLVSEVLSSLKSNVSSDSEEGAAMMLQGNLSTHIFRKEATEAPPGRQQRRSSWHAASADVYMTTSKKSRAKPTQVEYETTLKDDAPAEGVYEKKSETFIMDLSDPEGELPEGGRRMSRRSSWGHGLGASQRTRIQHHRKVRSAAVSVDY